ncbi:MAG: hypothetical protein IH612_02140 [Desulfofustis sp.]|nr:hypothetical protein [Desulfofustis sp.]
MFAEKLYRHAIDRINGRFMSGWSFHRIFTTRPVVVRVTADRHELGVFTCRDYRRDLKEQRLHPTGCCGFDFSFPADFDPSRHGVLHLYFDSCTRPLVSIDCRELALLRPVSGRPIFFMHIPKTAGTSFNAFARQCFAGDEYFTHIERLPPQQRRQVLPRARYLSGHLPWREIVEILEPGHYDLYAILREPVAHLHSHLNYVRLVHSDAEHEQHFPYRHNETIRALGGRLATVDFQDEEQIRRFVAELSGYQLDFFDNVQTRYFLDHRPERVTEMDYLQAVQAIERFTAIGLTEHYDRFRDRFCRNLGLPAQQQTLRSNRSQRYRLFDFDNPVTRKIIDPLVCFDRRLYDLIADREKRQASNDGSIDAANGVLRC